MFGTQEGEHREEADPLISKGTNARSNLRPKPFRRRSHPLRGRRTRGDRIEIGPRDVPTALGAAHSDGSEQLANNHPWRNKRGHDFLCRLNEPSFVEMRSGGLDCKGCFQRPAIARVGHALDVARRDAIQRAKVATRCGRCGANDIR